MWSHRHIVRFCHCCDLSRLGNAAGMTDIRLDNSDRAVAEQIQVKITGETALAGGDGNTERRDSATKGRVEQLRTARLANPGDAAACRAFYALWFLAAFTDSASLRRSRGDFCAGTPEALVNKIRNVDRFTVASLGEWDWRPALRAVKAPALVIRGSNEFFSLESAREWTTALPNGRLLQLQGAGHFPYLEVPERFFSAAESFLQGH
mgnify:CR=1 FL=1